MLLVRDEETNFPTRSADLMISIGDNALVSQDNGKAKRSWLEVASWVAGILATLIGLYALLK